MNNMQIIPSNQKIVEKILRDKDGRLVRATFCVYEKAGHIKARLVDFKYIEESLAVIKKVFSLNGFVQKEVRNIETFTRQTVSPYFTLNTLYFFGSKPRAPTFS